MKNQSVKIPTIKPRNNTVVMMKQMKAGSHRKSNKSLRQQDRRTTLKETSVKEVSSFCG